MTDTLRIALAQANPTVGDVQGNLTLAREIRAQAADMKADLVVFPELFLIGYPPEDLVLKQAFQDDAIKAAQQLATETDDGGPALLISTCWREKGLLYNSVLLLDEGKVKAARHKHDLPNYGVFDEKRLFAAGPLPGPVNFRGVRLGVPICEDIWKPDVVECLEETGAEIIVVPNGSPYEVDKSDTRLNHVVARVGESGLPLIYVNQVGGQDELVFDGGSFVLNTNRQVAIQMPEFESALTISEWHRGEDGWVCERGLDTPPCARLEGIYRAAMLGLRDYVNKNGFPGVVLGMSGGIDSALSAAMAVDALGPDRVHCLMLPYRYTSADCLRDAKDCAENLGVRYDVVSIGDPVEAALTELQPVFGNLPLDVTEENIQSRMRGVYLMAVSNKLGSMLLTTGNKSEMAVGYATIYGDMNGGFNPIKDLLKMRVYELAAWRNANMPGDCYGPEGVVIPPSIISKAPSAELRPDQTDQDSLPPYPILDEILEGLIEDEASIAEIVERGQGRFDTALVERIERMVYIAEYKRRQAAPGVKISRKAFGLGRKYPITSGYRDRSGAGSKTPPAPKVRRQGVQ